MIIDVTATTLSPGLVMSSRELAGIVERLAAALQLSDRDFELRLVRDVEIAQLNETFLGCPGPTNVLSFPAEPDETNPDFIGSIVLSVDAVLREADLYDQKPEEHLLRLLTHALLHLSGLDHGPEMEVMTEAVMENSRAILAVPVY